MKTPAVLVKGVRKTFRRGEPVLKGIDLRVDSGEIVGLIGASGSGKSTLIRLIAGLERIDANEGSRIEVLGQTLQKEGRRLPAARAMRREIGVIFQQFNLVGRLSLLSNVLVGRLGRTSTWRGLLGFFPRPDRAVALEAIERVGLIDFARQRASTLSGGQQQRGAIARAMAQEARVVLADEPIASLDPASAEHVMAALTRISRVDGGAVLISLHQISHALKYCDRIVALKDGVVVYDGDAVSAETLAALYGVEAESLGVERGLNGSTAGSGNPAVVVAHPEKAFAEGQAAASTPEHP